MPPKAKEITLTGLSLFPATRGGANPLENATAATNDSQGRLVWVRWKGLLNVEIVRSNKPPLSLVETNVLLELIPPPLAPLPYAHVLRRLLRAASHTIITRRWGDNLFSGLFRECGRLGNALNQPTPSSCYCIFSVPACIFVSRRTYFFAQD